MVTSEPNKGIIDRIAFDGFDYTLPIERPKTALNKYLVRTMPLTGKHQVFVAGPERLRIEIQSN